jgi:hypothetical protein
VGVDDHWPRFERRKGEDVDFVSCPLDDLGDSSMKRDNYLSVSFLKRVKLPDHVAVVPWLAPRKKGRIANRSLASRLVA